MHDTVGCSQDESGNAAQRKQGQGNNQPLLCPTAMSVCAGKANGSSDRVVADMDDQSREVEQGIASALCQALPLLSVVIRDAAAQTTSPVQVFGILAVVRDQSSLMNTM